MKKFQFSIFAMMIMALVCVGFASCSSDDDDSAATIVGKWKLDEIYDSKSSWEKVDYEFYVTFSSDGKYYVKVNAYGQQLDDQGTWYIKNNILYIVDGKGREGSARIESLTDKMLIYSDVEEGTKSKYIRM